ncbi:MAG: hypothetical protein VX393_02020 [Pseudomonadota bacterium]|nr:hypothetical protein [Pseudomonadota bacterium]
MEVCKDDSKKIPLRLLSLFSVLEDIKHCRGKELSGVPKLAIEGDGYCIQAADF